LKKFLYQNGFKFKGFLSTVEKERKKRKKERKKERRKEGR